MRPLVSAEQIQTSIDQLAAKICEREAGRPLTVIAVMTGSVIFLADLIRKLDMPLRVGVIQARSYAGTARGALSVNADMLPDVKGRDVLVLDDIFDTGHTLQEVLAFMDELGARTIRSAVLVLKQGKQLVTLRPDYVGFEIPDVFVVGYGLDYNDGYRNLPYLAALEPQDIEAERPTIAASPSAIMAHPLRLAIAAPRFWPLIEDQPAHLLQLAESFVAAGHAPTVVTPLWKRSWPRQMIVGTVPLVRLRGSPASSLSLVRWMYSLSAWLREQAPQLRGVLVAGLRHEAYVALGTAKKTQTPVVLLAGEGDLAWQRKATFGSRISARCREAQAIVVPSEELADELARGGYARERLTVIPRRVPIPGPRNPVARDAARAALAAVNYDLVTTTTAPVALATGRLDAEHRLGDLVRAWRIVSARRSEARLWILGDGPLRDQLYYQIGDLDQRFRVLIPGTFDSLREIMQAADLFLAPVPHAVPPLALQQALAAGLPVVAADAPALLRLAGPDATGMFVPPGDIKALADAISSHFDHPAAGIVRASAIRQQFQAAPTPADEAAAYVEVFDRLGN